MRMRLAVVLLLAAALLPTSTPATAGLRTWTNGPLFGGRALVAAHPTRAGLVFAATTNGLYRTADGGALWRPTALGLALDDPVSALSFAPSASSVVYLVASSGLYRSDDSGQTWSKATGAYSGGRVEIHPLNDDVLYGAPNGSTARSTNGGVTWTPLTDTTGRALTGIVAISAKNPSLMYSLGVDGHRSTDGGQTWTPIPTPEHHGVHTFAIDPRDPGTIVAVNGHATLFRSTDRGDTWARVFDPPPFGASLLHRDLADPDVLYTSLDFDAIYRSVDGGATWRSFRTGLPRGEPITSISGSSGGALYTGLGHHGVYKWSSTARAWQPRSDGIKAPHVGALAVAPSDGSRLYAGGYRTGVARSVDGGDSWRWVGMDGHVIEDLAVHPHRPHTVYAAAGRLHRSRDGGRTWRALLKEQYSGFRAIAIAPSRPSTVYAATWGHTYRSTDGGDSWHAIRNGGAASLAVHPRNPDVIFSGGGWNDAVVRFSRDGGLTWHVADGLFSGDGISEFEFDPARPSRMYLISEWPGVARSDDGGRSWKPTTTDGTALFGSLAIDRQRPNVLYAAGGYPAGGVFRTADRGKTWTRMADGLGRRAVAVLALTRSGGVLHAGTTAGGESGQGVWSYRIHE